MTVRVVDPKEYPLPSAPAWMGSWLIRWRFWIFGILCLAIIALEYFVEPLLVSDPLSTEFMEHIVFFIVLASIGSLVELLLRTVMAKTFAVELLEIKHELSVRLEIAPDWNKLVDLILAFSEAVVDPERVVLLLNTESGRFEVAVQSQTKEFLEAHEGSAANKEDYCVCTEVSVKSLHSIRRPAGFTREVALQGYCVPLIQGKQCVAKLNLYLAYGRFLSERQANIFKNCASDMAIALTTAQMRKVQADLLIDQARYLQRHEISRNLHDALGQKLIYLRFKLDQLVNGNEKKPVSDICSDLEQMLVVANESCELVRGTLAVLNSRESPHLLKLLIEYSRPVVIRNQWDLTIEETGSPQLLLPESLQQILYTFGEALSNVERHAAAQKVTVKLIWRATELVIEVDDNGCGFELPAVPREGHYGLKFMRERVEMLGGCLDLNSTPGKGTRLTIELPISDNEDTEFPLDLHEPGIALNAD